MSWLYSRALVEEYSEACSVDFGQFAQSKSTPMPQAFWHSDKTMVFSRLSRFGMMFGVLTGSLGEVLLMWYRAGFHAQTFQAPEKAKELQEQSRPCGLKWRESLAKYDRHSHSWRTAQCSLFGGLSEYVEAWPNWGTMQNGELFQQPIPERLTCENESGFFVGTPTASMSIRSEKFREGRTPSPAEAARFPTPKSRDWKGQSQRGIHAPGDCLPNYVMKWPTPRAESGVSRKPGTGGKCLQEEARKSVGANTGMLNPMWVEWLMGWPLGWTDLKQLETGKFQQWCEKHGTSCAKEPPQNTMEQAETAYNSRVTQGAKAHIAEAATS